METGAEKATKNYDETVSVQHDWHLGLKEPISKFFFGIKPTNNSRTQFFDVQITKLVDEFGFAVLPGEGTIKSTDFTGVSLDEQNHLHVTFQGRKTVFVSPTKKYPFIRARTMDVSSTGGTITAADADGSLIVFGTKEEDGIYQTLKGHAMDIYRCMYFPSGMIILAGGMDLRIRLYTIDTRQCVRTFQGHRGAITGLGIIGVGKDILSCSKDGTARMWNCGSAEILESWDFKKGSCVELAVSKDSSRFAVISEEQFLSVIELHGEKTRRDISLSSVPSALCFSGDEAGDVVFVGFEDGRVAAYKVTETKLIGEIFTRKGRVNCLKFFRNRLLVAFNDGNVHAYSIASLQSDSKNVISAEYSLTGSDCDPIYDLAIQGENVYTACRDGNIRMYKLLWDV